MTRTPSSPQRRRPNTQSRQPQRKKKRSVIPALILFVGILAALVIIMPKEPTSKASTTVATQDGQVISGTRSSLYDGLRISEVMSANGAAVPDDMGDFPDYIEIWNSSSVPIDLSNVGLSDRGDSIRFIFPAITLQADGRIVVFASDSNQSDPSKALHAKFKLSSVGETVFLFDPQAYLIDSVTVPIMNADSAYCLMADGTYQITDQYSPGFPNTEEGFLAYRNSNRVTEGIITINEVMPSAKSQLLPDEDGELSDWLELYNNSDEPYPLGQLFLSNKENKPLKWKFPDDAVIPARGYYIVFCSGKDRPPSSEMGIAHTNFRISAERDIIILSDSRGRLLDRISIDNVSSDKSYGRDANGTFREFDIGTPLQPNTAVGASISDELLRSRNQTGVYITEVMASNSAIVIAPNQPNTDFVELYNSSSQIVYLEGYALSDNVNRARKWQFPAGAAILPNSYLTIFLDASTEQSTSGQYHTNFKLTRTGGECICFSDPNGVVLDKIHLPLIPTDTSYGRTIGLSGLYYYDIPSPGSANGAGFYGFADKPSFSQRGGLYTQTVNVTITVPEGTSVYYSTDGSIPTMEHTLYQGETLTMPYTATLRARAFKPDYQPSEVETQSYFVNALHTLPIVSLSIDPYELYNAETGMFVAGPNIDKSKGIPFRNAIYREFGKVPRSCYVEYYSLDNTLIFAQGLEVSLSGANSLDIPQKSLKFRAKSKEGAKYIDATLFDDRPFTQYKSFVLRMGGNDGLWTRLVDGLQSQLVDELNTTVIHQAWKPVVVYINGIYWGHYNLRERKDRYFVAQHEGLPLEQADNMDIITGGGRTDFGTAKEYNALIKEAKNLSPGKSEEDLKYLTDRVDVENLFDYMAIQMYFGNSDVGNMLIYKLHGEGQKFKWLLFDMDYGLFNSAYDSPKSYTKTSGMGQDNVNNTIFRKLLENDTLKDAFLTRLGEIFQRFTTEHMIAKLDSMTAQIVTEMPLHFARWSEFTDKAIIAEVPSAAEAGLRYWQQRVDRLKNVMKKRPNLFYGFAQDAFKLSNDQMLHYFGEKPIMPADAK